MCFSAFCIWLRSILRDWFVTSVLSLPTNVLQPHTTLQEFAVMIQGQFFAVFQLFARWDEHFYQKKTCKKSQMHVLLVKIIWNLKYLFSKEFASERIAAAYISFIALCKAAFGCLYQLLLVAATLSVTNASCERNLFKNEISENIPKISWPVKDWVRLLYFQLKRYELKIRSRRFRWWIWQSTR